MNSLTCSGCGRQRGLAPTRMRGYVYCSEQCSKDYRVSPNEERDALAVELARGWPLVRVARELGVSRQRVAQIINTRSAA